MFFNMFFPYVLVIVFVPFKTLFSLGRVGRAALALHRGSPARRRAGAPRHGPRASKLDTDEKSIEDMNFQRHFNDISMNF